MLYVYEFNVRHDGEYLFAMPYDFEGGTQGKDEKEVAEMAADWLKTEIEFRLMNDEQIPESTFGHKSDNGRTMIVAVDVGLDTIDAIPAHEAAEILGVSRARVSQMLRAGQLQGFRKGRDSFVTVDSVTARNGEVRKAGRPSKTAR